MQAEPAVATLRQAPSVAPSQLADLVASQAAWWWCMLLVRAGHAGLAVVGPLVYVAARAWLARGEAGATLKLAAFGAVFGLAGDQALVGLGLMDFGAADVRGAFMVALWAMFAVTLRFSASFVLRLGPVQRAALGAVAGPLAYAGGVRLGVLELGPGAFLGVGIEWAVALAVLPWLASGRARGDAR